MSINTSFTIKNNLASSIRNFMKQHGKTVSEKDMNTILQRMADIDAARDKGDTKGGSIFKGGHKYFGGGANDFVVQQNQVVNLSREEYNKLFADFLDPAPELKEEKPEPIKTKEIKIDEQKIQQEMEAAIKPEVKPTEIKQTPGQDDKIIQREVDGKKQNICIKHENGKKVRYAMNEDGTLGDKLIPKTTVGKNTYVTETKMNNDIRSALGLGENEQIPSDIKGEYVWIAGETTLVFKKDGQIMDSKQLKEYAKSLHTKEELKKLEISEVKPETIKPQEQKIDEQKANQQEEDVIKPEIKNGEYEEVHQQQPAVDDNINTPPGPSKPNGTKPVQNTPITGPMSEAQLNEYLASDAQYQKFNDRLTKLDNRMRELETKYNVKRETDDMDMMERLDASGSVFNMPQEELNEHMELKMNYKWLNSELDNYKEVMKDWGNKKFVNYEQSLNGHTESFTNLEQITLKDGRRAWKTDQGTFLPGPNGMPFRGTKVQD